MSKIRQIPRNIEFPKYESKPVENQAPKQNTNDTARYNFNLSEVRAGRDGYDYGEWRKHCGNGKHHGKGKCDKKEAMETFMEEMQKILQEQAQQAEQQAQMQQEQIKMDEVKYEAVRDDVDRQELKTSEIKVEEKKNNVENRQIKFENLQQNFPKDNVKIR